MRKTGYIDARRVSVSGQPLSDLLAEIKVKTDLIPSAPAQEGTVSAVGTLATAIKNKTDALPADPASESGNAATAAENAELVEEHIHTRARFLGARPGWDGTNQVNAASNDSLTPFQIDAGNDTWGGSYCILGTGDTPVIAGKTKWDFRLITITQAERATLYRIRFAWGASYAAAIAAGDFTEWEFIPLSGAQDSGPIEIEIIRRPAGTKLFCATWCLGQNTGTISFTIGLHEYGS